MKLQLAFIGLIIILLITSCDKDQYYPFSNRIERLWIYYDEGWYNTLVFNYDNPYIVDIEMKQKYFDFASDQKLVFYYDKTWRLIKEEFSYDSCILTSNYIYDENNLIIITNSDGQNEPYSDTAIMTLNEEGKISSDGNSEYGWQKNNLISLKAHGYCHRWEQSNTGVHEFTYYYLREQINFKYDQNLNPFEYLHLPPDNRLFHFLETSYVFTSSANNIFEADVTENHLSCESGGFTEAKYTRRNLITYDKNGLPTRMIIKDYPDYGFEVQVLIEY